MFTLPDSTQTDPTQFFLKLRDPDPTCIFSTRHNTSADIIWVDRVVGISFKNLLPCGLCAQTDNDIVMLLYVQSDDLSSLNHR